MNGNQDVAVDLTNVLTIEPTAAAKLIGIIKDNSLPPEVRLVLEVMGPGCSGLMYRMYFASPDGSPENVLFEANGIACGTDRGSLPFLRNAVVTLVTGDSGEGFAIEFDKKHQPAPCAASCCSGCCGGECSEPEGST